MNMTNEERPKKPKKKSLMSFYKFSTATFTKHSLVNPKSKPQNPIPPSISQDKVEEKPIVQSNKTQNHMMRDIFELESCRNIERKKNGGGGAAAEEGRKSVSHVERDTAARIAAAAEMLTVRILAADMPGFMQAHAFRCARMTLDSLEKFSSKHMAFNLKKEFDKGYGPAWHCIVGSSFGSFVTHSTGCFIYFSMDKVYVLLFKTKVRPVSPH
ncbi:Dynein 8 kDa light chain, flagellar outer arm [Cardamine amara subsp. amara]|uniref:Dynein 8 kDa light chain, flagellar outer arm n=1 Tax=Cardamine amara subsp. amara TaxID=228776 RepID=A0ABD0Z365_CARAN